MVLILRLCFLYGSQNKQRLLPYAALTDWVCITEVEIVYHAVSTEALKQFSSLNVNMGSVMGPFEK